MKKYLTKIAKLIVMLSVVWIIPFCTYAQVTATESFEDEGPSVPTVGNSQVKPFAQGGINFLANGRFRVQGNASTPFGANNSFYFLDSGDGPSTPTVTGNIGGFSILNAATSFKINSFAAYTASDALGNNKATGNITFIGTKVDGTTVSATVTITPTNTGTFVQNGLTFNSTALSGIYLTSIAISLPAGIQYIELDDINFTTQAVITNQFSINDVNILEGNSGTSNMTFTITRSNNSTASSVQVQSSNGTATAGSDYVAFPLTTLNFTAGGALIQTVNVTINGDLTIEPNETFTITLSNPSSGVLLDATGVGTILDDDAVVETFEDEVSNATTFSQTGVSFLSTGKFKVANYSGLGAGGSNWVLATPAPFSSGNQGSIKVTTPGKSVALLSVDLWSANAAGNNYPVANCTVTFTGTKADGTGTVTHTAAITPSGTNTHFTVNFAGSPLANVPLSEIAFSISATANFLQIDNFTFAPLVITNTQVSISDVSILEGTGGGTTSAVFTISRTNNTSAFSVDVNTSNNTATAGSDYTAVSSTLNFTNGGTLTQTITVPITKDAVAESNETFNIALSNATNGTLYLKQNAVGTILNDDGNIVETFEDEPNNATSFSENGFTYTSSGGYLVRNSNLFGSGSSNFYLTSLNNIVGNMGTFSLTFPNTAFTLKSLDAWVGTSATAFSSGPVTFIGTLFGGGTVSTIKTITATNNTGTGWQQNITFTGTPLNNVLLTSLQVSTGGSLKVCDIDNLNYNITYTYPVIALADASNNNITNGGVASIANNTDFGAACVTGSVVNKTYTIKNTGLSNLILSGSPLALVGGADASQFSVTTQPAASTAAAASTTFIVQFNPTSAGVKNATITLTNNDATNSPYVINIKGTGNADPTITATIPVSICAGTTAFTIPYSATTNTPITYTISGTGITTATDVALPASPILVPLTSAAVFGTNPTYNFTVKNANGCTSANVTGTITVNATSLPTGTQNVTQAVTNNSISATGCALIANVLPNGAQQVSGNVTAKVWVEATQPVQFVKRHYEITPATNAANATARVTLYFSDAEFNSFNTQTIPPALLLPISTDAPATITARKANIKIEKRAGTGDVNGTLSSYTGTITTIDPIDADIIWNATASRWEVSFNVVGFSGFWLKTQLGVLPLQLVSFTSTKTNNGNLLQWKTSSEINTKTFEIERQLSVVGGQWSVVGSQAAVGNGSNNYSYTDVDKLSGTVYYRLKMIDNDGRFTYSNIIKLSLNPPSGGRGAVYPNPITTTATLEIGDRKLLNTQASIIDANGKNIKTIFIQNNFEIIDVSTLGAGVYILKLANGETLKMIKK